MELFEFVVRELFGGLNSSGLRWCVLRNYESLPYANVGHDIDIDIDGGWSPQVEDIIASVCRKTKTHVQRINYIPPPCRGYVFSGMSAVNKPWYLQVDIHGGEDIWGIPILKQDELLCHRQNHNNELWIPHPVHEAIIKWLVPLLWGGVIKEKYVSQIESAVSSDQVFFRRTLTSIVGANLSNHVFRLLSSGRIQATILLRKRLILHLLLRRIFECPVYVLTGFARTFVYILIRRLFPPGIWATLVSDDESKSRINTKEIMSIIHMAFLADTTKHFEITQIRSNNYINTFYHSWKIFLSEIHRRTNRFGCVVTDNFPPYELAMNADLPFALLRFMPKPGVAIFIYDHTMPSKMELLKNALTKLSLPVVLIRSRDIQAEAVTQQVISAISNAKHREFLKRKELPIFKTTL